MLSSCFIFILLLMLFFELGLRGAGSAYYRADRKVMRIRIGYDPPGGRCRKGNP